MLDALTFESLENVSVTIENSNLSMETNILGEFLFDKKLPLGEQMLRVSKVGYISKRFPIIINENETVDIAGITLDLDTTATSNLFTITLSDDELNDDSSGADNISGLLASSLDVFQRTAAFEFSPSFFRLRGLDSKNSTLLINGIEMNKPITVGHNGVIGEVLMMCYVIKNYLQV